MLETVNGAILAINWVWGGLGLKGHMGELKSKLTIVAGEYEVEIETSN